MESWQLALTRGTAWLAMAAYVLGLSLIVSSKARRFAGTARWLMTVGATLMLLHVLAAFQWVHAWSHRAAWDETARRTAQLTGALRGEGLWLNYLFVGVWVSDVAWWWCVGHVRYAERNRAGTVCLHAFLLFLSFNAMVVFVPGPLRWLGVSLMLLVLLACLWRRRSARLPHTYR